jgi:hypothetical protein
LDEAITLQADSKAHSLAKMPQNTASYFLTPVNVGTEGFECIVKWVKKV